MRKIAANLVYPCIEKPIKFGHLVVDDDGTILDIVDTGGKLIEEEGLEYHNGVLVPGFIVNSTNADMTEKACVSVSFRVFSSMLPTRTNCRITPKNLLLTKCLTCKPMALLSTMLWQMPQLAPPAFWESTTSTAALKKV